MVWKAPGKPWSPEKFAYESERDNRKRQLTFYERVIVAVWEIYGGKVVNIHIFKMGKRYFEKVYGSGMVSDFRLHDLKGLASLLGISGRSKVSTKEHLVKLIEDWFKGKS
jgi:hypothetical protein